MKICKVPLNFFNYEPDISQQDDGQNNVDQSRTKRRDAISIYEYCKELYSYPKLSNIAFIDLRGKSAEYRYRLWGTDASGFCIEAIVAPYPDYGLWRCVTAFPMSDATKKAYFKRIKK